MSDINAPKQTVNTIIIVAGVGLLLYDFLTNPAVVYFKISGLVILMFGLYKSTQQWTSDNKTNDRDEESHANEDNIGLNDGVDFDKDNIDQNGK